MEGERSQGRVRHGWNSAGRRSARNTHDWVSAPGSFDRRAGARSKARRAERATAALEKKEERLSVGGRDKEKGSDGEIFFSTNLSGAGDKPHDRGKDYGEKSESGWEIFPFFSFLNKNHVQISSF
jgi:hypothetical protein